MMNASKMKAMSSGHQGRKKKQRRDEQNQKLGAAMKTFLVRKKEKTDHVPLPSENAETADAVLIQETQSASTEECQQLFQQAATDTEENEATSACDVDNSQVGLSTLDIYVQNETDVTSETGSIQPNSAEITNAANITEPNLGKVAMFKATAEWPSDPMLYLNLDILASSNDSLRKQLVQHGPCRPQASNFSFPITDKRHFPTSFYKMKLEDNKKVKRTWLCYSPAADKAFCFPCWLFASRNDSNYEPNFSEIGVKDWKHFGQKIVKHESAGFHLDAMGVWKIWQCDKILNKVMESELQNKANKLRQVFHRLLDIVLYLAKQNLAFRGSVEKFGERSCGNFLATVQLLAKYDPLLSSHLYNPHPERIAVTYLSPQIQNEIIQLCANEVLEALKIDMKEAKYFSIIADTTTDVSHIDQLSIIIRYVKHGTNINADLDHLVAETFTGFIPVGDASATGLEDTIAQWLEKTLNLNFQDCRGQGYDGASVMSGAYNGVSAKIRERQNLAIYVHCASHCLNLVLCDAAATSVAMQTFFGILQKLYTFLSSSNIRWNRFIECCTIDGKVITVKKVCETRWESRVDAVTAVINSYSGILMCLNEIRDDPNRKCRGDERVDIDSLLQHLSSFQFVLLLIIWERILLAIRVASKIMQKENCDISVAADVLSAACDDMKEFRVLCHEEAVKFSVEHHITPELPVNRHRTKKRMVGELAANETMVDPIKHFEVSVFNTAIDVIVNQLVTRLQGLCKIAGSFSFLQASNLFSLTQVDLTNACSTLCQTYKDDLNNGKLLSEILSFRRVVLKQLTTAQLKVMRCADILGHLLRYKLEEVYPNVVIAYKLLLTIPVAVASCERSFSKLKLVKNYLRSSMAQERLSALALLSIENDTASKLNFEHLITAFASAKARKGIF